jgi:hypothetical protein
MLDNLARTQARPGKPCRCGRSVEAAPSLAEPWPGLDCDCCFAPIPDVVRGTDRVLCDVCAR